MLEVLKNLRQYSEGPTDENNIEHARAGDLAQLSGSGLWSSLKKFKPSVSVLNICLNTDLDINKPK